MHYRCSLYQKAMAAGFLLPNCNPRIYVKNLCTPRIPNINSTTSSKNCRFLRPLRSTHRHDNSNESPPSSSDECTQSKQVAEGDGIEDISMPMSPSVLKALEGGGVGRRTERSRLNRAASSSSDESTQSKQDFAEDDGIEDISKPISPSVLKALEGGGIGRRTEINRLNRAASSSPDESTQSKQGLAEDDGIQDITMPISLSVLKALKGRGVGWRTKRNRLKTAATYAATPNPTETPAISFKEEGHKQISKDFQLGMPRLQKPGNLEIVTLLQLIQQFTGLNIAVQHIGQKPNYENLFEGCNASLYLVLVLRKLGGLKYERDRKRYSKKLYRLVAYKYLEDQLRIEMDNKNNSRADKLAPILAQMKPVVPTVHAPKLLMLYAFKGSGFTPDGRIGSYEDGFIFPGKLEGRPEDVSSHLEQFLGLIRQDNIVILMKSRKDPNEAWCVIAPWTWLMGFVLPDSIYNRICVLSFLGALVGALQFSHADPGLEPILWEPLVIPSLLLSVVGAGTGARWLVASKYGVTNLIRWPVVFPCLGLGIMGAVTGYKGRLPNRSSFLNLSLASIFGSLTFSFLLVLMGYSVGSSNAFSGAVVDFHGYFLVPLDMFSHSSFFTFLLRKVSIASYMEEMGNLKFVISPISLAGLLGLNFCAFQLLPVSRSDGSRILEATLGREAKGNISMIVLTLLTICFMLKNPLLGFAWWSYIGCSGQCDDLFQREEVTEPPLYGKLLGLGLVLAAFASFVPVMW